MKNYRFFFHYNKPASKSAGTPKLSVHYKGKCYIVDHINCGVPIMSRHNKRQPVCAMIGMCNKFLVKNTNDKTTVIIS